jgi:hypothetical protein
MGARLRWACATRLTMRASKVSAPTFSARITSEPVPLMVPPISGLPASFSTGSGSPLTSDSSIALPPSSTTPSTGTFSPGRTRKRSPAFTSSSETSSSLPSRAMRRAVVGASRKRLRSAELFRLRASSSITCPSSTSVTITAAASKCPHDPASRNDAG